MIQMLFSAAFLDPSFKGGAVVIPFCNPVWLCQTFFKVLLILFKDMYTEAQPRKEKEDGNMIGPGHMGPPDLIR